MCLLIVLVWLSSFLAMSPWSSRRPVGSESLASSTSSVQAGGPPFPASSSSSTAHPSSTQPMKPISQPGLRVRAAYRAYLPPRPSLSGFRRSFRTTGSNGKDQTGPDGEPVMGSQKKKRRGMGCE